MTRKNIWSLLVMVALGVGISWYSLRNVKLSNLMDDILTLNWWWLLVALGCVGLYFGLEAVVVQKFVRHRYRNYRFKSALRVPLAEQLFNGITPFSSGGQPAQIFVMAQSGIDAGRASSVALMKFVVFQAMVVLNFLFAMLIGFHYLAEKLSYLSLYVLLGFLIHFAVIVGLLLVMYWYNFTKRAVKIVLIPVSWFMKAERFAKFENNISEKIDSFYEESVRMTKDWRMLVEVCIITFLQLLFYYLIPYFIMRAMGIDDVNLIMVTSLNVLIFLVTSLFPIPGGAGGAEFGFTALFAKFIPSHSKLILAMLIWRILTYYLGLFLGMIAMAMRPEKAEEIPIAAPSRSDSQEQ
ncbi:lysylphosphatidylglycerol synthase transmembrane domain-containing protein [Lactiplantibacillus plantarum]|uniref:lysylphosphatidylglycerol synthase transmembrane domain-containing protein n=1 Tax=Lactiplantibacillus plantarum TaxID=1590 RepID=UPI003CE8D6AD